MVENLRILVVTQQMIPHVGGLSTHVETLVDGLTTQGHVVGLVHGGMAQRPKIEKLFRLVASLGNRDKMTADSFRAMLRTLRTLVSDQVDSFNPNVIHCHDVYASSAAISVSKTYSIPIIQTVHGPALYEAQMGGVEKRPRFKEVIVQCERDAFNNVDNYIAVDSGQAGILREDYDIPAEHISVIFNCVDVDDVRRLSAGSSPILIDRPFFLVPRRLVQKNGVRYAIEAMAHIQDTVVELLIAGQGPLRTELEALSCEIGLTGRVKFLGGVPRGQLMPLFAHAQGVIIPSVPASGVIEATSLAVTEAMACGSVPIASRIGGLAELIEDNVTGLLVPPADPKALAHAMDSVLIDNRYREEIIEAAKSKVEQDYSLDAWLVKTLAVYNRALSTGVPL